MLFVLLLLLNLSPLFLCKSEEAKKAKKKDKEHESDEDDEKRRKFIIKQNHPGHCRCGEAERGAVSQHVDIQDLDQATTTTSTTPKPEYGQRFVSVRAIDDRVFLPNYKTETEMLGPQYKPFRPNPRPWLVVIEVVMRKSGKQVECTGAVLAPSWVLSSRSCVCGDRFGCNLQKKKEIESDIDIRVYPAANYQRPASDRKPVNITKVSLHYDNFTFSDLALLRLQETLDFQDGVMPICLPQDDFDEDESLDVYISGFNFHFHHRVPEEEKCRTVAGPQKWRACRFPFLQKLNNKTIPFSSCSSNPPPSHPECHDLMHAMNWTDGLPITTSVVKILKNVTQEEGWKEKYPGLQSDFVELECQGEYQGGVVGWCGTCLLSKGPGEPGHCGEGAARSKSDPNYYAELARPTAWGGWGYCDPLCSKAKTFGWEGQLKLLEVMRKVSSHRECESFLRGRGLETQLCLFQEQDLRSRMVFTMVGPGDFRQVHQTDGVEMSPIKAQPSVGDAGAPIFRLIPARDLHVEGGPSERAVLVGILSTNQYESLDQGRGSGISQQVVSRIVPVMPWIRRHVDQKDALCFKDKEDKKEKRKDKKG